MGVSGRNRLMSRGVAPLLVTVMMAEAFGVGGGGAGGVGDGLADAQADVRGHCSACRPK